MTKIEWTEATWNPIVGCSILTPGCTNCYAMKMAARIEAMGEARRPDGTWLGPMTHYAGTTKKVNGQAVWTGKLALAPDNILLQPLKRKKPTTYFVNSMGDLFHEDCPDEWIDRAFAVMAICPQHKFQVLTKRAKRMREYIAAMTAQEWWKFRIYDNSAANAGDFAGWPPGTRPSVYPNWPLENVWLGVSTERQKEADERIPELLNTPAAVRFISAEPLLGAIDLRWLPHLDDDRDGVNDVLTGRDWIAGADERCGEAFAPVRPGHEGRSMTRQFTGEGYPRLDWVIVGGESGPGARPMEPSWARALRDQCAAAGVPYFFKQWGHWQPVPISDNREIKRDKFYFNGRGYPFHQIEGFVLVGTGKGSAGRKLDGITHDAMPGRTA